MKLRRVSIENVRSFLDRQELQLSGDISILIGPNGGGKTNLLDTAVLALRLFLLKSWTPRHNPTAEWHERYDWTNNDALTPSLLERHSAGGTIQQSIELDLEVTSPDIENITRAKLEAATLQERAKSRYTSFPGSTSASWETEGLVSGMVLTYRIVNGTLLAPTSKEGETFRSYLETYEVNSRVREEFEQRSLSMPMISLPVNRSAGNASATISLATFNEYDYKRNVDAASSRISGSIIALAIGRLASRYRVLLERADGRTKQDFKQDLAIQSFTSTLKTLGYDWELACTNPLTNQYDIQLSKQGSSFSIGAASSGEKELLTYLFAIFALNVRDALIVIDEPELHLHPRWQRTLLELFERLSRDTGNQFVMATHSPVFVSPASIQYVSRVYAENQKSKIVRLGDSGLPEPKHLFGIVNSQNNERVFFGDLVILVEGISDRIFFEAVFRHFNLGQGSGKVYEVVSVGGKTLFKQYEKLLTACRVPFAIIADLDYLKDIGDESVKDLFSISSQDVKENVIDDPTSIDGRTLVSVMDDAIQTGNTENLRSLWEYIKGRQTRLRTNLSTVEKTGLQTSILEQRHAKRFVLSKGALEAYLPSEHKDKDLEKLIRLVAKSNFWEVLPSENRTELREIADSISLHIS